MTGLEVYAFIKAWLPLATVLGLVVKAYLSAKKGVSVWANTLLDNHMTHIQEASEKTSAAIVELADYHKEMLSSQTKMLSAMERISDDFREHARNDDRVQGTLLTGVEVLKIGQQSVLDELRRRPVASHFASVMEEQPDKEI